MDYSLLLGVHDCARAEQENRERAEQEDEENNGLEEDDDSESGSGLDMRGGGGGEKWGWGGAMATPPDSPHALAVMRDTSLQYETGIVPELDIYAIPSSEGIVSCMVKAMLNGTWSLKYGLNITVELFSVHGNCLGQKSDKSCSLIFSVCITFIEFV